MIVSPHTHIREALSLGTLYSLSLPCQPIPLSHSATFPWFVLHTTFSGVGPPPYSLAPTLPTPLTPTLVQVIQGIAPVSHIKHLNFLLTLPLTYPGL